MGKLRVWAAQHSLSVSRRQELEQLQQRAQASERKGEEV